MTTAFIFSVLTAFLFVTFEPISKLIGENVTPYAITFIRFFLGSLILIPPAINRIKKNKLKISAKDFFAMSGLGIFFICICMVLLQVSIDLADNPALIAIVFASNSVFTFILSVIILKEKLTKPKIATIVLCSIGVIFCADFKSGSNLISVLISLLASVCFSLNTVLSQKYNKKYGSVVNTGISFATGSITLLIFLMLFGVKILPVCTVKTVLLLLYLGFIATGIGFLCYFTAAEKGGPIYGSMAFFIKTIFTPLAAFIINNIVPGINIYIAVIFIVAGSFITIYSNRN